MRIQLAKSFAAPILMVALLPPPFARGDEDPDAKRALDKAVQYLAAEVPAWKRDHQCYSCHNNGDAARALYLAGSLQLADAGAALADTTAWLKQPERWQENGGSPEFSDHQLADLQFAHALAVAVQVGAIEDRQLVSLTTAAQRIVLLQADDGSWQIGATGLLGSPTTYGPHLATAVARKVLQAAADAEQIQASLDKSLAWLLRQTPKNNMQAAAILWALAGESDPAAVDLRGQCLDLLRRGQHTTSRGWGPYVQSRPEAFDTALVLIALSTVQPADEVQDLIQQGRQFLVRMQTDQGHWPETTRPDPVVSYAQRLSTTGWATQALLLTRAPP